MKPDAAAVLPRRPSPGAAGACLAALYEEHARLVFGICRMVLRDPEEAEDAAQQVFLSAYRGLLAGTEPRNPGAWLSTIARNESRRRIATRALRPLDLDGAFELASATLEEEVDARSDLAELRTELSALPEKQREAVVLRDLFGLRYDEVARALGISRPAVEALLFRGRRKLQRRLRPEIAAGVLVVPLALRESLAYAVPGFAAGGASTAGVLAKLSAVPIAAKLAAAGATVSVVGSAGVIAERELEQPSRPPAAALVERAEPQPQLVVQSPVPATVDGQQADDDVDTRDEPAESDEPDGRDDLLLRNDDEQERDDEADEEDETEETRETREADEPDEPDEPEDLAEPDETEDPAESDAELEDS